VRAVDLPEPELVDLRSESDPVGVALRFMRADLEAPMSIAKGARLYRHILFRPGAAAGEGVERWFWFQRYHHLSVDGFGFTAIARRVSEIYSELRRGLARSPSPESSAGATRRAMANGRSP
jgi:hypothetical protein